MEPGEKRTLCFPSCAASARQAGAFSRRAAEGLFADEDCCRIELALVEAFTNTVEHAYGGAGRQPVWLSISREPEQLVFELEDEASPSDFNPAAVPQPCLSQEIDQLPEGGWGVFLMNQIMDGISHTRSGGRNRLRLAKTLPEEHRVPPDTSPAFAAEVFAPPATTDVSPLCRQLAEQEEMVQEMAEELSGAYESLNLFFNFSRDVTALTDEKGLQQKIIEIAMGNTEAAWAVLRLQRRHEWLPCVARGNLPDWLLAAGREGTEVENQVLASGREEVSAAGAREALMCVPIRGHECLLGTLLIGGKPQASGFSAGDVKLARALADQAAASLDNQRLVKEVMEAQVARHELQIAQHLQQQFYPRDIPEIPGLQLVAEGIPARLVGGDYIGFRQRREGTLDFIIADVMGKGMQAAFFSALTHVTFRGILMLKPQVSPAEVLSSLGRVLSPDLERFQMFMTALCGHLDLRDNRIIYASAGHCAPILLRTDGQAELLDTPDVMLGIHAHNVFQQREISFQPGCRFLLYTDGFTDYADANGNIPGPEPLRRRWQELRALPLEQACRRLMDETLAITTLQGLPDDIALMAFHRLVTPA